MSRKSGTTGTLKSGFAGVSFTAVIILSFLMTACIPYFFFVPVANTKVYWATLFTTAVLIIGGLLFRKARPFIERKSHLFWMTALIALCLGIKLLWVLLYRIEPLVDYETFYITARDLSKAGSFSLSRYVALFPHIFGYSYFLSLFFAIFGESTLIPPLVNVLLTCISAALIYFICNKLFSKSSAVAGALLWILSPSQTMYNMFALSEPLYSALILGIWALIINSEKSGLFSRSLYSVAGAAALIAALAAALNAVRPIALILIISLFVFLFITGINSKTNSRHFRNRIVYFLVAAALYFVFSSLISQFITATIGEKPAAVPGYSLYVGFNEKSFGRYNQADADLLFEFSDKPGWSANDAQREMFNQFKKRISSGKIDFPSLLRNKYEHFWEDDSAAIYYMRSIIPDQNDKDILIIASNGFYQFTILLSCLALFFIWKRREHPLVMLFPLFMIGLSLAQMLVEVAGRYHYSGILVFTILSAYIIFIPVKKK